MAKIETWFNQDLREAVKVRYIDGNVFSQDNQGNIIGVSIFDGGVSATLSGTVSANVIRADGTTVAVDGTLSGNKCSVVLPQSAYAVPGVISIIIKLTSGSDITTVCAVVSNVYMSSTDTVVDPGTIIPSIEALIAEIEAAVDSIPADYSSLLADIAPAYSSSALYSVGQYVWYDGDLKRCIVPITTAESYTASHWTNAVIGNDIHDIGNNINNLENAFYAMDILANVVDHAGFVQSSNGAIYNGGTTYKYSDMISVFPGDVIKWKAYGSSGTLGLAAYESMQDTVANLSKSVVGTQSSDTKIYYVPDGIYGIRFTTNASGNYSAKIAYRSIYPIEVSDGDFNTFIIPGQYVIIGGDNYTNAPFNNSVSGILIVTEAEEHNIIYQIFIRTNGELYSRYYLQSTSTWRPWGSVPSDFEPKMSLVGQTSYDINNLTDVGIYTSATGNENNPHFPPSSSAVGTFVVTKDNSTGLIYQAYIESYTGVLYTRIKRATGWDEWAYKRNEKEISILFIGNSLTQDGIAYLPYLLKTYYPEINFRFYMWYNGGKTLKQQYEDYFYTDTACNIFSVAENVPSWTNYNNTVKMSAICTTYKFDIVCMQEYFNYKTEYTEADGINDWNNCRDYITSHYTGGNGLEFISLFHAPLRNNAPTIPSGKSTDTIFQMTLAGNELILKKTISDDMIPNGIGIYRALSTSLDSLGDMEHLSPDGTHTQEGLPCLLQTFVAACWLFDRLGLPRSVYGCPIRMTTAIYNTINVPGPNLGSGVIEGTDAQNLLAQEVAIKAYKEGKYYVENNIFAP